jgi:hypothetical protein
MLANMASVVSQHLLVLPGDGRSPGAAIESNLECPGVFGWIRDFRDGDSSWQAPTWILLPLSD